jgi:hypothetical protein
MSSFTGLFLLFPVLGVPAPKALGIPPEMIEQLPEDTTSIMVVDMPHVAKSPIGKGFIEGLQRTGREVEWLDFERWAKDVEIAVIGQHAIVEISGDFCCLFRLREGSELPKLIERGAQREPLKIGKHTVIPLFKRNVYYVRLEANTIAIAVFINDLKGDQEPKELETVFGAKKKGPRAELRKLLVDISPDHAIAVVSEHPKTGYSGSSCWFPSGWWTTA